MKGTVLVKGWAELRRIIMLTIMMTLLVSSTVMASIDNQEVAKGTIAKMNVTASYYHNVVYNGNGQVWYWGGLSDTINGKLIVRDNRPQVVQGLEEISEIHSFHGIELILKEDGSVWKWGTEYKRVNDNNHDGFTEFIEPVKVLGLPDIEKISVGTLVSAIDAEKNVWVWSPSPVYDTTPRKLTNITGALEISMNGNGELHILLENGTVWKWEAYEGIQLNSDYTAEEMKGLVNIVSLSSGYAKHNFAVDKDGLVWGWGMNHRGALGYPLYREELEEPTRINGVSDVSFITTNANTTVIVKNDGSLWVMGNDIGESVCFASRKCLVLQPKVPSPLASIAVI